MLPHKYEVDTITQLLHIYIDTLLTYLYRNWAMLPGPRDKDMCIFRSL